MLSLGYPAGKGKQVHGISCPGIFKLPSLLSTVVHEALGVAVWALTEQLTVFRDSAPDTRLSFLSLMQPS